MNTRHGLMLVFAVVVACKGDDNPGGSGESGGSGTGTSGITTAMTASQSTTDATTTSAEGGTVDGGTMVDGSGGTTEPTGGDGTACSGQIWQCGDGMDNDGDGKTDLEDPECTGPCDDDKAPFQTGLPGDNMDCKQDCFFDGNSGQGDDGCIWDLTCDPANPGANVGCEYDGGNNCDNQPPNQEEGCITFCEQFVPPGCDCFGCCTVCDANGENCVDIYVGGSEECSLDNLEACTSCTPQIEECGNPCVPEDCEICIGQEEPPPDCGPNVCDNGLPCEASTDCAMDFYCLLGCCYPPPPG